MVQPEVVLVGSRHAIHRGLKEMCRRRRHTHLPSSKPLLHGEGRPTLNLAQQPGSVVQDVVLWCTSDVAPPDAAAHWHFPTWNKPIKNTIVFYFISLILFDDWARGWAFKSWRLKSVLLIISGWVYFAPVLCGRQYLVPAWPTNVICVWLKRSVSPFAAQHVGEQHSLRTTMQWNMQMSS
jgi:hypothetical protein